LVSGKNFLYKISAIGSIVGYRDIWIYGCREKRAREMLKETEKNKGAAYCNL